MGKPKETTSTPPQLLPLLEIPETTDQLFLQDRSKPKLLTFLYHWIKLEEIFTFPGLRSRISPMHEPWKLDPEILWQLI